MSRTQIDNSRKAQASVSRTDEIAMLRSVRFTVVSGTMPTPTLHSTRRQMASKLRNCTRSRNGRPTRFALSAKKSLNRAGAVEADHVVVEHLGEADARAAGERMVLRHHQHEAIAAERKRMQAAVIDSAGDDADIGRAFRHQPDDLVGQPLLEIDADIGISHQERAQRLGQEFGKRIGVGKHPHLAGEPARVRGQIFLQAFALRQDAARVLKQCAPGLGRHHALAAAHQQFGAES